MFPNWKSTLYELNIHEEDVRLIGTSIDRAINEKAARHIAGQKFSRSSEVFEIDSRLCQISQHLQD